MVPYSIAEVSAAPPFHKNLFDFTPLLELELVLDLVWVIRVFNSVGNILDIDTNHGQEGLSRSIGNIGVRGRPFQQKFGCTGTKRGGIFQRCQFRRILGIWIGAYFQEELNKVEAGHVALVACIVQRRYTVRDRYSVDIGALVNTYVDFLIYT
jgi:hypothetical protein